MNKLFIMCFLGLQILIQIPSHAQESDKAPIALTPAAPKVDLAQAYKREYLFLNAQKRELTERATRYEKTTKAEIAKSSKLIEELERKYLTLTREVEKQGAKLTESERNLETLGNEKEALETMLERSQLTLSEVNLSGASSSSALKTAQELSERIKNRFILASKVLKDSSNIKTIEGTFYLKNGEKTSGEIINLGRAASFGVTKDSAFLLAPSGRGELKVWKETNRENVNALKIGNFHAALEVYLHESSTKEVTQKEGKTFSDIMKAGGSIGWVILALGIVTILMVTIRAWLIYRAGRNSESLVNEVSGLVSKGESAQAIELLTSEAAPKSAISRLMNVIINSKETDKGILEDMASEQMIKEWAVIDKFGTLIIVAASVAPLLGLLGTVTGMIATFDIITEFGTGDPKMLSSGISEALVTTMMGLIVAIPALMLGSVLSAQSDKIKSKMEQTALTILNSLSMARN